MFDTHSLFPYSTIASITSDSGSVIVLTVQTGDGALFAVGQNIVLWPSTQPLPLKGNAYVGRITAISTDTLTISYPQEGSTAKTAASGWQIMNGITPKVFTDIEDISSSGFSVYLNATPSITQNTDTKITFDTKVYDLLSEFDVATNHRFTATKAGKYLFTTFLNIQNLASGKDFYLKLFKNGAEVNTSNGTSGGGTNFGGKITAILSLAASDYIEVFVNQDDTASRSLVGGSIYNCFMGQRIA